MGTSVILFLLLLAFGFGAFAEDNDAVLQRLEDLSHRVDHLESREKLYLQKINDLESRDQLQQATINKLEKEIQEQRQLIETMEETQQATLIELEIQRQLLDSIDVNHSKVDYNATQKYSEKQTKPSYRNHFHSPTPVKKRSADRIRRAEFESPVAFYATIHNHSFEHGGVGQIIIYDNIITNAGNGYNGNIGVFIAPAEGIYVFSTTMVALARTNGHVSFYKNSDQINVMYTSGTDATFDTTGSTIVLQLQKGDVVTVRNTDADKSFTGSDYSSFAGFLLSSNTNNNVVIG